MIQILKRASQPLHTGSSNLFATVLKGRDENGMLRTFLRRSIDRSKPRFQSMADSDKLNFQSLQGEVSLLQAEFLGVQSHIGQFGSSLGYFALSRRRKRELRDMLEGSADPCLLIDPRPGLRIVDANNALATATLTDRDAMAGVRLFAALPGGKDCENVASAFDAYKTCAQTLQPVTLLAQRYDIEGVGGEVLKRCWDSHYFPIKDDSGQLVYILNRPMPLSPD